MADFEVNAGVKTYAIHLPVSRRQLTASNTAQTYKRRMEHAGKVVKVVADAGVYTYGTIATDIDISVRKNTTVLHSVPIPIVDSSTLATTDAVLSPTLVALRTTKRFAKDDYLSAELEITGGSTPVIDGMGVIVHVTRE